MFSYRSIWGTAVILVIIFSRLAYADLSYEKELLPKVPTGIEEKRKNFCG